MEPLTPNTSAILSMLSAHLGGDNNNNNQSIYDENSFNPFDINAFNTYNPSPPIDKNKNVPASLPPSAFFPIPGRDTPEDTPPSTHEASQSPEKILSTDTQPKVKKSTSDGSGDSEVESRLGGGRRVSVNHKRKAGLGNQKNKHVEEEEDDEEDDSDEGDEHEDKRVHQNAKTSGAKKGGRKSVGEDGKGPKENKAARRKEQNRAAQKAFRERREAKVKDLEEKVAELERKSYGTSVENENLRGILKRLQEENVALRQNAFTFSMPVNGTSQTGNSTGTSTPIVGGPQRQQSKPLSPPISNDDVLHSIYDVPPVPQRKVSSAVGESPDSLHSVASGSGSLTDANGQYRSPPSLFQGSANAFDTALPGNMRPAMATSNSGTSNSTHDSASRSNSGLSPASTSSNGRTELDALWASFLQQGAPQKDQYPAWNANAPNMMGALDVPTNGISFADPNAKVASQGNTNNWDKSAFRDTSAPAPQSTQNAFQQPQQRAVQPQAPTQSADPWSSMMDNSMDDFLASLTGANVGVENDLGTNDEDFNAQLQQILGSNNASPSNAFSLPGMNPFSPTNYLNMSPSPLVSASVSNEPSPQTASGSSVSASASPESIIGLNDSSRADSLICERPAKGVKPEPEHLYVVDESGKVIKPSELWVRMGMQHESNLEHLLIDDLCDMMRSKATCKDGKAVIQAHDAENLFKYKSNDPQHVARLSRLEQRAGIAPGAFTQPQ